MGCLVVDQDGVPLRPMMIWADTRSVKQEQFMKDAIGEKRGYQITGHRLSASYSAAKLLWIKEMNRRFMIEHIVCFKQKITLFID